MLFCMLIYLLVLAFYDVKYGSVPLWLLGLGGILTAVGITLKYTFGQWEGLSLLFGLCPGVVLIVVSLSAQLTGLADGIVLSFLGIMLGGKVSFALICVSLFLMAICSVILLILKKVSLKSQLPFLPFMCSGYLAMWCIGAIKIC